jgi:hypothetical protein
MLDPRRNIDVASRGDGNNCVLVRRGYFTDEFILAKRQREGPIRAFALAVVVESGGDNHCIHLGCQLFCGG